MPEATQTATSLAPTLITRKSPSRLESRLAHAAEPLLLLARQITGLETTLVRRAVDEPTLQGGTARERRTFWAAPTPAQEKTGSSVCGASQLQARLTAAQLEAMQSIANCLQNLLEAEREACLAREREQLAEQDAIEARNEASRHASDCLRMERLAHTDELTGLLNRRAFMDRWQGERARSESRDYPIALLVIDADKFKRVNDTFGHLQGDAVLRAIGATLLEAGRAPDIIARLGGDEFALVTTHSTTEELVAMAADIQARFEVLAAELGVDTTLSIGIVSSDHCGRDQMVAQADAALYRSKTADGNEAELYLPRTSSFTVPVDLDARHRRVLR